MDLITLIIIIAFISKIVKKAKETQEKNKKNFYTQNVWDQLATQVKTEKAGTYQMPKQNVRTTPAYEQITLQQAAQQQRTQQNTQQNTAYQQSVQHRQQENKSAMQQVHAEHQHPEDILPESMLGSIEDLMIKGYDGNLCFERDFIGEAMDMISRFTVPS